MDVSFPQAPLALALLTPALNFCCLLTECIHLHSISSGQDLLDDREFSLTTEPGTCSVRVATYEGTLLALQLRVPIF